MSLRTVRDAILTTLGAEAELATVQVSYHGGMFDFDALARYAKRTPAAVLALPRVDIIYACIDMPADLIDGSVSSGAKGIVIAGDGNGNMNTATLDRAARAATAGVVIVRSSRVHTGRVGRNLEVDDDRHRFIASDELNPAKARILLMLALLKDRSLVEIQQLFYDY